MKTDYNKILVDICNSNIIIYYYNNVIGCEESSFNRNSNRLLPTDRVSETTQTIQLLQYTSGGSTYGYVESLRLLQSNY